MKKLFLLLPLVILAFSLKGQQGESTEATDVMIKPNSWALSLNFGASQFYGDIASNVYYYTFSPDADQFTFSAYGTLEKHFSPWYALRLRGGYTTLTSSQDPDRDDPLSFEADLWDIYLENKVSLTTWLFPESVQKRWSSYALLGYGVPMYRTILRDANDEVVGTTGYSDDGEVEEDRQLAGSISVGLGFRVKLSHHLAISAEAMINNLNKDDLDATVRPLSKSYDKYGYTSLGLVYTFGKNDRQVPMEYNPMKAEDLETRDRLDSLTDALHALAEKVTHVEEKADRALARFEGPDSDGDGIADAYDLEPDTEPGALVNWQGITIPDHSEKIEELKEKGVGRAYDPSIAYESVYFGLNSTFVSPDNMKRIARVAQIMKQDDNITIKLVGSSCRIANADYNMSLSKRRAEAVQKALTEQYGIDAGRISIKYVGEEEPLAEEALYINRRVDFFVVD